MIVNKSKGNDISGIFAKLKDQIQLETGFDNSGQPYIPDILEFCNSPKYLNFPAQNVDLFPMQRCILKCFYRGQPANEHLKLSEEEIALLKNEKMDAVLEKYYSDTRFRELVLVLGRRAGKDFLVSIIALYEAMRLLESPGGDPFAYYKIAAGNPIYIMTVANSADQARILFDEIRTKLQTCEYFKTRIGSTEADRIFLLTPADKKLRKQMAEDGISNNIKGSVVIMSGHSNSDSLLGKSIFTLLLDEVASFKTTGNSSSGSRIYSALGPSTATFKNPNKKREDGKPIYDSKIISISSPRSEEGILWELYKDAPNIKTRLAFKLPSWKVSMLLDESSLREEFKYMASTDFAMEFGAEFSGTTGEKFISDKYIDEAMQIGLEIGVRQRSVGDKRFLYYAHLDPASTSHNYALAIIHVEDRVRHRIRENGMSVKEKFKMFVVDHLKIWSPAIDKAINIHEVDQYIIDISKHFKLVSVSYDDFNSLASIQKLRQFGVPTKLTAFRKQYKMQIYDSLETLFINHQIALPSKGPEASLLAQELKCLKRIYVEQGWKIKPNQDAQVTTDDLADALAGAIGAAGDNVYSGYVRGGTVYLPQSRDMTQSSWNIGTSSYLDNQLNVLRKFGKI
jgi:hypothetical protein